MQEQFNLQLMDLYAKCMLAQPIFLTQHSHTCSHTETSILSLRTTRFQRSDTLPFPCEQAHSLVNLNYDKFQTNSALEWVPSSSNVFKRIAFYPTIKFSKCTATGELHLKMGIHNIQKIVIIHCTYLYSVTIIMSQVVQL